jgi:hypothetical protein
MLGQLLDAPSIFDVASATGDHAGPLHAVRVLPRLTGRAKGTMKAMPSDDDVLTRIDELVADEHRLRGIPEPSEADRGRLAELEARLDQCWDLLRQRRARAEAGEDPSDARTRSADQVETYLQ